MLRELRNDLMFKGLFSRIEPRARHVVNYLIHKPKFIWVVYLHVSRKKQVCSSIPMVLVFYRAHLVKFILDFLKMALLKVTWFLCLVIMFGN